MARGNAAENLRAETGSFAGAQAITTFFKFKWRKNNMRLRKFKQASPFVKVFNFNTKGLPFWLGGESFCASHTKDASCLFCPKVIASDLQKV